jgi:two-component system, NtrC family, sensor kinase
MNQSLQNILNLLEQSNALSIDNENLVKNWIKEVDKYIVTTEFKLDRTEQVKRTTAILLEETIEELELKRKAIEETNVALQKTLEDLKAAQAQLIQSEKMASLGELTAGIAHEIQNPLNFVNNFSDLSVDLAKELKEETEKAEIDKELIIDLATDLSFNQEKINHHGKRASDIVRGMLEHSRSSTGQKESTDINALCDEYLRLAYHGLRAKDKSFNATLETHFDPNLPKIDIIPQDIGRVLLNLITNAFYAVNERSKKGESSYDEPKVTLTTQLTANSQLLIAIKDNGTGIPDTIKDKIFQPFFTTKPTGQGTGLGLSLSYDIVKAHGGDLIVDSFSGLETKNKDYSTKFTISLRL